MTNDEIVSAFAMRLNGATLAEIGAHFNVTKQRIQKILESSVRATGRRTLVARCIYPGLRKWFIENGISASEMFDNCKAFACISTLYKCLAGKQKLNLAQIQEILCFTGLTFEEAFGMRSQFSEGKNNDIE